MKKTLLLFLILAVCTLAFAQGGSEVGVLKKIPIKVLILPKWEEGGLESSLTGEARFYYNQYVKGGETYKIDFGVDEDSTLYVKDGVALYLTGIGKVNAAISTFAVLTDERFDFSNAYIISTGCAGSATEQTVMGDVFIVTASADYDLGHHADYRDLENKEGPTWFHDSAYDGSSIVYLSTPLTDRAYELTKNVAIKTTEKTRSFMAAAFDGAAWAIRDPKVQKGTMVTSDNYWKGYYNESTARQIVQTYNCPDPYVADDMEDIAISVTLKRMGFLDRYLILRVSVNMDVFMMGATPESIWTTGSATNLASEEGIESADIFPVSMENNFKVGKVIIDAILDGTF